MTEAGRITAIIDGDISGLTSKLAQAKSQAISSVSGIESDMKGKLGSGLTGALSGGNWGNVGKNLGQDLVSGITAPLGSMGGVASSIATTLGPAGIVAVAGIAGAAALGSAASSAAMEWEAGMSQISKTTGIVKGSADFEDLNSGLKDLYSTMPTTVSEIQSVAAAAGSLGIEKASIAGFTNVALQMGSAFDIPAEQAATAIGKIKGQLKSLPEGASDSADFAMKFGSAVDYVGNNFNATEKDVLDFSTRVSGSMSALGAGAYEVAGWGGMLSSVFPSAERAAGSFDSLLTNLTTNTDSQSKAAEVLGITTEEFMQQMTQDPSATLLSLGKAMEGLPTDKLMETAKTLGGAYGMDTLVKMVGHTEEWGKAIDDTVEAGKQGTSIGTSFQAGADNMKSGLQVLKNSVGAILTDMGGPINAAFAPVITAVAGGLNKVRAIGENLWGPITAGLGPLTSTISTLIGTVGELGGMTLDGLVAASEGINTAFDVGSAFVSAFREELTKVITSSSTFQTLSGYVDQVGTAFSNLSTGAGEVFDKIVSGLSNAIPTAISGTVGALGTLMDKAGLGGVADALGGVGDFFGKVYDNAMGKLGLGAGDAMGEGIKGSDKLKNAPGDALGSDSTISGVDQAAKDLAKAFYDTQAEYIKSHSSGGYSLATMQMMAGQNGTGDLNDKVLGTVEIGGGIFSRINYDINDNFTGYRLTTPTGSHEYASYQDFLSNAPKDLETYVGRALTELEKAEFLGDAQKVVQLKAKANAEIEVDAYLDFAANLKDELAAAGEEINVALLDNLTPDSASIESRLESIRRLKLYDPEEAKRQGADNAIAYLGALHDSLDSYESAKVKFLAEPDNEQARTAFETALGNLQQVAEANPLKIKADTSDLYSEVFKALMQGKDWASMGVTNPQRFLQYSDEALKSQISEYAKMGVAVPKDSETYQLLQNMSNSFTELQGQGLLDSKNQITASLLQQALANPGGYQWEQLYAWSNTLPAATQQAGTQFAQATAPAGSNFVQQIASSTAPVFQATDYFRLQTNSAGQNIAVIGTQVRTDGVSGGAAIKAGGMDGGAAVASGCQTGANAISKAVAGFNFNANPFNSLYAAPATTKTAGVNNNYPLASSTVAKEKNLGFAPGSDLNNFGWVPQGWKNAMDVAGTATTTATKSTDSLCASYSVLDSGAGMATSAVSGLSYGLAGLASGLANQFYPLAGTMGAVAQSTGYANDLLKYTAESMDTWCDAASDFAYQQETTAGMFKQSYIGPTEYYPGNSQASQSNTGMYNPSYQLPPVFMASEAYVASPTLAVVGDRPGGEYVVGAARFENAVGKMGGSPITINCTVTVQGDGDLAAFEAALVKRNKELVAEITAAARGL
jgi:TP901 family phage tail tape measure protein